MSVAPTTELELGRNLKPDSIVEGNDVYFECRIRCNPPPLRIMWTHEVSKNSSSFPFASSLHQSLFFIAAPIKTYRSLLLLAEGKPRTWKIGAFEWKDFVFKGNVFLLFCSTEPQKDLVIQIESLLLHIHIEQTMELFLFFSPFYYFVWFWMANNNNDAIHCLRVKYWQPLCSMKIDFNVMLPCVHGRVRNVDTGNFVFASVKKVTELCQQFS